MVNVAQLVRATDCGSVGRGFEPHLSPLDKEDANSSCILFVLYISNSCLHYIYLYLCADTNFTLILKTHVYEK